MCGERERERERDRREGEGGKEDFVEKENIVFLLFKAKMITCHYAFFGGNLNRFALMPLD